MRSDYFVVDFSYVYFDIFSKYVRCYMSLIRSWGNASLSGGMACQEHLGAVKLALGERNCPGGQVITRA